MSTIWIYHEPQDSALCGQHCLNNLWQDPLFTAGDLAEIAHVLDNKERSHMLSQGMYTADALKFLAEESGNVDAAGNFSIQVLEIAMQNVGINLIPWNLDRGGDPLQEMGFIVNRQSHWFALRKINGHWWDLNSTQTAPQYISQFYLAAFLAQLAQDGYSVFVAKGDFPTKQPFGMTSHANWYREADILPASARKVVTAFQGVGHRLKDAPPISTPAPPSSSSVTVNGTAAQSRSTNLGAKTAAQQFDDDLALAMALSMSDHTQAHTQAQIQPQTTPQSQAGIEVSKSNVSQSADKTQGLSEKEIMRIKRLEAMERRK